MPHIDVVCFRIGFSCCGGLSFVLLLANVWAKERRTERRDGGRERARKERRKEERNSEKIPKFPKSGHSGLMLGSI